MKKEQRWVKFNKRQFSEGFETKPKQNRTGPGEDLQAKPRVPSGGK